MSQSMAKDYDLVDETILNAGDFMRVKPGFSPVYWYGRQVTLSYIRQNLIIMI